MTRTGNLRQQMIRDGERWTAVYIFLLPAAVLMVAYVLMLPLERGEQTMTSQRMDHPSPSTVPVPPK
jgi:hypothetical protein